MNARKIKEFDNITPIFTKGQLPNGKIIGDQGTAPKKVMFVEGVNSTKFASGVTEWVTLIPTVYNADTLGIRPDLIKRPIISWSELLNPEFKGKASILNIPSIGIMDAAMVVEATGKYKYPDKGNISMPRIGRRNPRYRLLVMKGGVSNRIAEAPGNRPTQADFADGEADRIPRIALVDRVWQARRPPELDTNFANAGGGVCESNRDIAPARYRMYRQRGILPNTLRSRLRIVAGGQLNGDFLRPRLAPLNAHRIDGHLSPQIDHDPLCQAIQVRIALPERVGVAVVQTGIAVVIRLVGRISAAGEFVTVGNVDRIARSIGRKPVALLLRGVAPRAARVPMPRFAGEFGSESVCERLQPGGTHCGDVYGGKQARDISLFVPVDAGTEGHRGIEGG